MHRKYINVSQDHDLGGISLSSDRKIGYREQILFDFSDLWLVVREIRTSF